MTLSILLDIIMACTISVLAITTWSDYILSAPLTYVTFWSISMSIEFIFTNNKWKYSVFMTPIMQIPLKPLHNAITMVLKLFTLWSSRAMILELDITRCWFDHGYHNWLPFDLKQINIHTSESDSAFLKWSNARHGRWFAEYILRWCLSKAGFCLLKKKVFIVL